MYALYWLIIFSGVLVVAGIIENGTALLKEFHRKGMERVRKLDR